MSRPTDYEPSVVDAICARLADGQSLREICRDDAMPNRSTVFRWLRQHEEFREQYALAREAQADAWADEIVEIADDASNDWIERQGKDGEALDPAVNGEHIQRSRVRIDTRKWLMARAAPKKYGDKVAHEVAGKDGGDLVVEIVRFGGDPTEPLSR